MHFAALAVLSVAPLALAADNVRTIHVNKRQDMSFLNPPDIHSCQGAFPDAKTYRAVPDATLRKLFVFHRHGARVSRRLNFGTYLWNTCMVSEKDVQGKIFGNQVSVIPNDEVGDMTRSCKPMQLSSLGHQQLRKLGNNLRSIYFSGDIRWSKGVLTKPYVKEEILVRSTKTMRTLESAQELLSGIYKGIEVGPIPVAITPSIAVEKSTKCPINAYKETPEWKKLNGEMTKKLNEMNDRMQTKTIFRDYTDTMIGRICHRRPLPCNSAGKCITFADFTEMEPLEARENEMNYASDEGSVFRIGKMLEAIVEDIENNVTKNLIIYSSHDYTISALAGYFKLKNFQWPGFAANMMFEIWERQTTNDLVIRLIYNGQVIPGLIPIQEFMDQAKLDIRRAAECKL